MDTNEPTTDSDALDPFAVAVGNATDADDPFMWLLESMEPGGRVVNEGHAREGPCESIDLGVNEQGEHVYLNFHRGIIGPLDQDQTALYCVEREIRVPSEAQRERIQTFRDASHTCSEVSRDFPKGERIQPFVSCLQAELQRRGVIHHEPTTNLPE